MGRALGWATGASYHDRGDLLPIREGQPFAAGGAVAGGHHATSGTGRSSRNILRKSERRWADTPRVLRGEGLG